MQSPIDTDYGLLDQEDTRDNLSALAWVHEELRRSLEAANKALRRQLREAASMTGADIDVVDPVVLRTARQQLHQGVGALELVGLPAAATVLRACETAVQRFIQKPARLTVPASEAIERASFALLDYVTRLLADKDVSPLSLFPQYRAVQEISGADRVHPADLWQHAWSWRELPADPSANPRQPDQTTRGLLEQQLLGLMRGGQPKATAARMSELCAGLAAGTQDSHQSILWKLAAAFFEGQARGLLVTDVFSKRVASRLLAQFRIIERGSSEVSERLAQDILFFCSQCESPGNGRNAPRLAAVRLAYGLAYQPIVNYGADLLGRFDPAWVAQARKRVVGAKDAWSAVAGGELHRLQGLAEQISLVGDSLKRLFPGGESLADELLNAVNQTVAAEAAPSPPLAMEVATSVLYVEAALEDADFSNPEQEQRVKRLAERIAAVRRGRDPEPLEPWMEELYHRVSHRQTMGSVVYELRSSLSETEQLIDQYFRNPSDPKVLTAVPSQLLAMRGVLAVLGMDHAAHAVQRMGEEVDAMIAGRPVDEEDRAATGQPAAFERLAGNLGALDFLIDMIAVQPQMAQRLFVYDAETGTLNPVTGRRRMSRTSADAEAAAQVQPRLIEQAQSLALAASRDDVPLEEVTRDLQRLSQQALAADQPQLAATVSRARASLENAAGETDFANAREQLSAAMADFVLSSSDPSGLEPEKKASPPAPARTAAGTMPAPGEDTEMLGVFLEEAHEVIAQARESMTALRRSPSDLPELTTLRRAFHTLKGSSRMVGLAAFGDAAWAGEQLFNSRLGDHQPADDELLDFAVQAVDYLESWTDSIEAGYGDGAHEAAPVEAAAEALRRSGKHELAIELPVSVPPAGAIPLRFPIDIPSAADLDLAPVSAPLGASLTAPDFEPSFDLQKPLPLPVASEVEPYEEAVAELRVPEVSFDLDLGSIEPASTAGSTPLPTLDTSEFDARLPDRVVDEPWLEAAAPAGAPVPASGDSGLDIDLDFSGLGTPVAQPEAVTFDMADFEISSLQFPDSQVPDADGEQFGPASTAEPAEQGVPAGEEEVPAFEYVDEFAPPVPAGQSTEISPENAGWDEAGVLQDAVASQEAFRPDETAQPEPAPAESAEWDPPAIESSAADEASAVSEAEPVQQPWAAFDAAPDDGQPPVDGGRQAPALDSAAVAQPHVDESEPAAELPAAETPDATAGFRPEPGSSAAAGQYVVELSSFPEPVAGFANPPVDEPAPEPASAMAAEPVAFEEPPPSGLVDESIQAPVDELEVSDEVDDTPFDEEQIKSVGPLRISTPLFNIYLNEADELSRRLNIELSDWALELDRPVGETSIALAHSLAGSSSTVGFSELSHLSRALEHALSRSQAMGRGTAEESQLFSDVGEEIRRLLHQFAAGFLKSPQPELKERLAQHEVSSAKRLEALNVAVGQRGRVSDFAPLEHSQVTAFDQLLEKSWQTERAARADEAAADAREGSPPSIFYGEGEPADEQVAELSPEEQAYFDAIAGVAAEEETETAEPGGQAESLDRFAEPASFVSEGAGSDISGSDLDDVSELSVLPELHELPELADATELDEAVLAQVPSAAELEELAEMHTPPMAYVRPQDEDEAPGLAAPEPRLPLLVPMPRAASAPSGQDGSFAPADEPAEAASWSEPVVEPAFEPVPEPQPEPWAQDSTPIEPEPEPEPVLSFRPESDFDPEPKSPPAAAPAADIDLDLGQPFSRPAEDLDESWPEPVPFTPSGFAEFSQVELKPLSAMPELLETDLTRRLETLHFDADDEPAGDDEEEIDAVDAVDPELFGFFEEEALELLPQLSSELRAWARRPDDPAGASPCMRTLHTLKGGARLAGAMRLGELAHRLESRIENVVRLGGDEEQIATLQARADAMSAVFDALRAGSATAAEPMPGQMAAVAPALGEPLPDSGFQPFAEPALPDAIAEAIADATSEAASGAIDEEPELLPESREAPYEPGVSSEPGTARETPAAEDTSLQPADNFAGDAGLGAEPAAQVPDASPFRFPTAESQARAQAAIQPPEPAFEFKSQALPAEAPAAEPPGLPELPEPAAASLPAQEPDEIDWSGFDTAPQARTAETPRAGAHAQATVRVRAPLLERMVNQAGEVSITRSRIAAEVATIKSSLGDLGDNLDRLREQLRNVELQAETQLSSQLEAAKSSSSFDPLEFDRFTRLQELTRMMAESVNDVATVQRTLQRSLESTEDELAAQARLTRELQDDLLRTRMIEFEGLSDRLYRVVRQAAKETGKQVRLDIVGGSIEVDRGVLDRMTGSFEHLVRNSVTHGIESAALRAERGKDTTGSIVVALTHEGNEVGVEFRDDGGGLDLLRIREKGIALGLLDANAHYSDSELANLIFSPGFSTAGSVTELAGRGIGMDVVRSDVNAMGGRIETATAFGRGASFKLVLPLTTAVTQVVMLRCGDVVVAVPSTLIEIVRRTSGSDLVRAYESGRFPVGDAQVPFFWLGALLQQSARSGDLTRSSSVVVVRSAQQRLATHVDEVIGNQEVVVKNLGPQLSRMPGLVGITLLASGVMTPIYNPVALASLYGDSAHALMTSALRPGASEPAVSEPSSAAPAHALAPLVLVVDDSLTVRRVTQRLLVREGYRVTLAKDGLEALEMLADERPALVLSDIEMPKMDGFDLVRNIRGDAALRDLPVIMITSRIAQKHRDYAAALGVDHYLGKPYSEEDLLALISQYVEAARV